MKQSHLIAQNIEKFHLTVDYDHQNFGIVYLCYYKVPKKKCKKKQFSKVDLHYKTSQM